MTTNIVKRMLWQRTLERTVLREPLPKTTTPVVIGMDFAAGGARDQTGVRLVGERGPELFIDVRVNTSAIEAWSANWQRGLERSLRDLQIGSANFAQALQAMQIGIQTVSKTMAHVWVKQMVREMNEGGQP